MPGGRVVSVVLCRPTVSGDIVPIAMGNCENLEEATKYNSVKPPSDTDVVKLVKSRVRTYFNNDGVIELDGGPIEAFYKLSLIRDVARQRVKLCVSKCWVLPRFSSWNFFILLAHNLQQLRHEYCDGMKLYHLFYAVTLEPFCTMIYCCVGENSMVADEALEFLNEKIRTILASSNIQMVIAQANSYDLLGLLQPDILKFIKQHNEQFPSAHQQRMIDIRRQVDDVRAVMADNVERLMERGDRLENIENRTEALRASSTSFKSTARRVQRHFCQQNLKWTILLTLFIVVVVLIVVLSILHSHGTI